MSLASRSDYPTANGSTTPGWLRQLSLSNLSRFGSTRSLNSRSMQQLQQSGSHQDLVVDRTPVYESATIGSTKKGKQSLYYRFTTPEPEANEVVNHPGPLYHAYVRDYLQHQQHYAAAYERVQKSKLTHQPQQQQLTQQQLYVERTYAQRTTEQQMQSQTLPRLNGSQHQKAAIQTTKNPLQIGQQGQQLKELQDNEQQQVQQTSNKQKQIESSERSFSTKSTNIIATTKKNPLADAVSIEQEQKIQQKLIPSPSGNKLKRSKTHTLLTTSVEPTHFVEANSIDQQFQTKVRTRPASIHSNHETPPTLSGYSSIRDWSGAIVEPIPLTVDSSDSRRHRPRSLQPNELLAPTLPKPLPIISSKQKDSQHLKQLPSDSVAKSATESVVCETRNLSKEKPTIDQQTITCEVQDKIQKTTSDHPLSTQVSLPACPSCETHAKQQETSVTSETVQQTLSETDQPTSINTERSNSVHNSSEIDTQSNPEMVLGLRALSGGTPRPSIETLRMLLRNNPRLCELRLQRPDDELGFNLNTKKRPILAHLVIKINPRLAGSKAGLVDQDQLLTVDGVDCRSLTHQQVVKLLRQRGSELRMLVCDPLLYQWTVRNSIALDLQAEQPFFHPTQQTPRELLPLFAELSRLDEPDRSVISPESPSHPLHEMNIDQRIPYADYDDEEDVDDERAVVHNLINGKSATNRNVLQRQGPVDPPNEYAGGEFVNSRSIHLQDRQPRLHIPSTLMAAKSKFLHGSGPIAASTPLPRTTTDSKRPSSSVNFSQIHVDSLGDEDERSTNGSMSVYDERYGEIQDDLFARDASLRKPHSNNFSYESKSYESKSFEYTSEYRAGPSDSQRSTHRSMYTKEVQQPLGSATKTTKESFEDEKIITNASGTTVTSSKTGEDKKSAQPPKERPASERAVSKSYSQLPTSPVTNPITTPEPISPTRASRGLGSSSLNDLRPGSMRSLSHHQQHAPLPTLLERPSTGSADVSQLGSSLTTTKDSATMDKHANNSDDTVEGSSPNKNEEDQSEGLPAPRLCTLKLAETGSNSFGFTVKTDKKTNLKSIIEVTKESVADKAGIRANDVLIEVNGVNVSIDNHRQVTERIKSMTNDRLQLLVLSQMEYEMYQQRNVVPKSNQSNVIRLENFPELLNAEHVHLNEDEPLAHDQGVEVARSTPPTFWGSFLSNLSARQYRHYLLNKRKPDPRQTNLEFQEKIKFFEKL